jgi:Tol biopolymer transport system component
LVEDGNLRVWEEATSETRTLVDSGDVIAVTMSGDGQVVAFLRRSAVQRSDLEWYEQSALWAVDGNGENPRELVSAEELRSLLGATETDSTNIPQMEWIPGTHRLLYSGWTYLVQAEGESHAVPEGLYQVDADTATNAVLVAEGTNLRFVPSPDGEQIALMSPTSLGFVNVDGTDLRQDVLTYPAVGITGPLFPVGAWAEDSHAFLITGSLETDPAAGFNFSIWRVPVDGSQPDSLANIRQSHPDSVTFSPDGRHVAAIQYNDEVPPQIAGWFITPLAAGVGSLAIPNEIEVGYAGLHWSPAGGAYTGTLMQLCPGATADSDVCDSRISFSGTAAAIRWIGGDRLLFLTREPSVLFLVSSDGTSEPISAWPLEDWVGPASFAAADLDP